MAHGTVVVIARQGDGLCITFKLGIQEVPFPLEVLQKAVMFSFCFCC